MRVLFASTGGAGHFGPLVPVARACREAGHAVRFAVPRSRGRAVEEAGFEHAPLADPPPEAIGAVFAEVGGATLDEGNAMVVRDVFGRLDAQAALPAMQAVIDRWRPDVVVRETAEVASWAAATCAGVPQAHVAIGLAEAEEWLIGLLDEPLAELQVLAGLPVGGGVEQLLGQPRFTSAPASLDTTARQRAVSTVRFRESSPRTAARLPPPWGRADDPLVYVSFGSVTADLPQYSALYQATLDAIAELPARVLLTTGTGFDPAALAPWPPNVHVERWWPQAEAMPEASAVVGHGGFGTTMLALAAGVPQVIVPLFASDQHVNARHVAATGAGVCLDGGPDDLGSLADAIQRVLGDPGFGSAAAAVAGEISALPDVTEAVAALERLAGR